MELKEFNDVAYYQVGIARKYMRRHNLTPLQFVEKDKQYHILHFLEVGYEPFHLTGDEGVLDELDEIVAEQQSSAHLCKNQTVNEKKNEKSEVHAQ